MNTTDILSSLDGEIARLRRVRDLLADSELPAKRRGRPKGSTNKEVDTSVTEVAAKKRTMSPEGKARIAAAQRARWAKLNAPAKSAAKTGVPKKRTSGKALGKKAGSANTASVAKKVGLARTAGKKVPAKKVATRSRSTRLSKTLTQPRTAPETQPTE